MSSLPSEEYCSSCGGWFAPQDFDYDEGWCRLCTGLVYCVRCGNQIPHNHANTVCHPCRQESWFRIHGDELELLIVAKGYSVTRARTVLTNILRPICQVCKKPIKGGVPGETLFCGKCKWAWRQYRKLTRNGAQPVDALAQIRRKGESR